MGRGGPPAPKGLMVYLDIMRRTAERKTEGSSVGGQGSSVAIRHLQLPGPSQRPGTWEEAGKFPVMQDLRFQHPVFEFKVYWVDLCAFPLPKGDFVDLPPLSLP